MLASEWNKQVGFYLTDRKVRWGGEEARQRKALTRARERGEPSAS